MGQLSEHNFQLKKCYNFIENYYGCLIKKQIKHNKNYFIIKKYISLKC